MTDFIKLKQRFDELELRKSKKFTNKIKYKNIIGFDTETVNGKAILLCSSDGRGIWVNNIEDILKYLTQRKFFSTLNFFWNIDYDFFAIVKYLPSELLDFLYEYKAIIYKDYFIKWIPRKFFSITKNGRDTVKFFDLWQFYRMSLNEAAQKYLKDKKDDIDVERVEDYLKSSVGKAKLFSYCFRDTVLTAKLGSILQEKLNVLGIDFSKPYSSGYISMKYFFAGKKTPFFKKEEYQLYAFLSYYGGRFEVLKRGYFPKVYQYDINSAYPYYIKNLIDLRYGEWKKSTDLDLDNAYYGFARINITEYINEIISPIPWRNKNLLIFPNFEEPTEHYLSFPEIRLLEKIGGEFDVIDSYAFYPTELVYPFRKIEELYNKRKEVKKNGDRIFDLVLKIIMNSLYGKFAEKHERVITKLKEFRDAQKVEIGDKYFYAKLIKRPGLLFCPVYAAYITAQTRTQLLETCLDNIDSIVMFATDSVLTTKPFIEENENLGGWKLETKGEAIVLMSGVYTVRNEYEKKSRFRGFPMKNDFDFFEILEKNKDKDKIEIDFEKVVKLGEVIAFHNIYNTDDLNIFTTEVKQLSCLSDEKRDWLGQPLTFAELLEKQYDSVPKTIRTEDRLWKKNTYHGYKKMVYDWMRTREIEETAWLHERMML
jgi:hypothetical protein